MRTTAASGHLSDERLVALFREGRDDAFDVLHDRYRSALVAFARRVLGGPAHDAEDVVQEAFLRAHAALRAKDNAIAVRPWLYLIVRNRAIDVLRARRPSAELQEARHLSLVPAVDPEHAVEQRDRLRRVVDEIGRLPERQRTVLVSHELEGISHAELAARLDTSVAATKALLHRARAHLKQTEAWAA